MLWTQSRNRRRRVLTPGRVDDTKKQTCCVPCLTRSMRAKPCCSESQDQSLTDAQLARADEQTNQVIPNDMASSSLTSCFPDLESAKISGTTITALRCKGDDQTSFHEYSAISFEQTHPTYVNDPDTMGIVRSEYCSEVPRRPVDSAETRAQTMSEKRVGHAGTKPHSLVSSAPTRSGVSGRCDVDADERLWIQMPRNVPTNAPTAVMN